MVGDKDKEGVPEWLAKMARQNEWMLQKIQLKGNGVEMELGAAKGALLGLTVLQEDKPQQFEALVAIVKPRGATRLQEKISPRAVTALKKSGMLRGDGLPDHRLAAVLDASYVETDEGVVLRDPVIYPSREFVEKLTERERMDREHTARILWQREEGGRRKRDLGEGPSP